MKKISIVVIILLLSTIIGVNAIVDRSLNYHETDFINNNWFISLQDLEIENNALQLTGDVPIFEDYTTWTENDATSKLSETSTRVTFTSLSRDNDNTNLYTTKTNQLQNFQYYFKLRVISIASDSATIRMQPFIVTSYVQDYIYLRDNNYEFFGITLKSSLSTTLYSIILIEMVDGTLYTALGTNDNANLSVGVTYYIYITKSGTSLHMHVYTDENYTTDDSDYSGGLSLTLHSNYNYQYLLMPDSTHLSGTVLVSGYMEYLTTALTSVSLQGIGYTKNLLENETDIAYMINSNHTINAGCSLKIYVSPDNSTWTKIIDTSTTGKLYDRIEDLNLTLLYCKLELNSNGLNNMYVNRFGYSNIENISVMEYDLHFNFTTTNEIYTVFNYTFFDEGLGYNDTNNIFSEYINGTLICNGFENSTINEVWFTIYQIPTVYIVNVEPPESAIMLSNMLPWLIGFLLVLILVIVILKSV